MLHDVIYPYPDDQPGIKPGERTEMKQITMPTDTLDDGKYLARVDFEYRDEVVLQKKFVFAVGEGSGAGIVLGASNGFWGKWWSGKYLAYAIIFLVVAGAAGLWLGRLRMRPHVNGGRK